MPIKYTLLLLQLLATTVYGQVNTIKAYTITQPYFDSLPLHIAGNNWATYLSNSTNVALLTNTSNQINAMLIKKPQLSNNPFIECIWDSVNYTYSVTTNQYNADTVYAIKIDYSLNFAQHEKYCIKWYNTLLQQLKKEYENTYKGDNNAPLGFANEQYIFTFYEAALSRSLVLGNTDDPLKKMHHITIQLYKSTGSNPIPIVSKGGKWFKRKGTL